MGKKRGNREGSIYKRKDGRWEAALTIGWEQGKLRRKYFSGKTRQDVAAKLTAALRDRDRGSPVVGERLTVGDYLADWLENRAKPTIRPSTYTSYAYHVRVYLVPSLGHIRLAQLTPQHVQALMNQLIEQGLSPASVQRIRATLRKALSDALRWDLVTRNAAALATPPARRAERARRQGRRAAVVGPAAMVAGWWWGAGGRGGRCEGGRGLDRRSGGFGRGLPGAEAGVGGDSRNFGHLQLKGAATTSDKRSNLP